MTGCRIGRVKLKNGAELLRFPTTHRDDVQRRLVDTAAHYAKTYPPGTLQGFIIIGWSDSSTISQVVIDRAEVVNRSTAPSFAAEEVRRALHQQGEW